MKTYRPGEPIEVPKCCQDATDGEMVRFDQKWMCVWCGRESFSPCVFPVILDNFQHYVHPETGVLYTAVDGEWRGSVPPRSKPACVGRLDPPPPPPPERGLD